MNIPGKSLNSFRAEQSEIVEELKNQLKEKEKQLNNYRKEHGKLELFFNQLADIIQPITPAPVKYKPKKSYKKICASVFRISDLHVGEIQTPYELNGINEYSWDICQKRCIDYAIMHNDWTNRLRESFPIHDVHVLVTGDLISGDIHDELKITNEFPVTEQTVKATEIICKQIVLLSANFNKVVVEFITEDNHGRLTKKPQAKEAGKNNFNYIIGHFLKKYLSKFDNVQINVYEGLEKIVSVLNRNYLICHGHHIRSWMGVPYYGIIRYVGKRSIRAMQTMINELQSEHDEIVNRAIKEGFHKVVMGHHHQYFDSDFYNICPSMSGVNAFDQKCGNFSLPGSLSWIVHPEHGDMLPLRFHA